MTPVCLGWNFPDSGTTADKCAVAALYALSLYDLAVVIITTMHHHDASVKQMTKRHVRVVYL